MAGTSSFPHLLAPGRIGTLELRNRILMCPMGDSLCNPDGSISPNQAAYFEARAKGGAALLLVGSIGIAYPRASFDERQVAASDDRYLPGLIDLTSRVHAHGGRIAAQLVHNGQLSLLDVANGRPMLVPSVPKPANPDRISMMVTADETAAMMSPFTQPTSRVEYRVATEADIAEVIEQFVDAAERCVRAGFDAIELHAGHGYLIDEFLTPSMNTRTDGWGGGVENRARLLCDVIRALRARLGREQPLWIRINAVEHHKAHGETFEEQQRVIELAQQAGIDAVHVTAYANTDVATGPTDSYAPHRVGPLSDYAAAVRARVDVPVITFGRYEPDEAEGVLAAGKADFVAMGRKLLADPDLPNKLREGRVDDIRPCLYQYRCIGNIFVKESLHCVANAATGREHDLAMPPTASPRHVLIIGGGAAGLETARVLSARGHRVTLWEAGERLGGVLVHAGRADPLLDRYVGWLARQVEQAGVELVLGRRATLETVRALGADEVVVATGAVWGRPAVAGADLPHVFGIADIGAWLEADGPAVGTRVAVLGGGKPGLSIADLCARRGRQVTIVEPTHVFGSELGLPGRWRLVADLEAAGVRLLGRGTVVKITPDAVYVNVADGDPEDLPADTVIATATVAPDATLADALDAAGIHAHLVGDCAGIRRIEGANLDAAHLALALG
ncbi:MAG TPA: FAD-dependent oxidoreductase [Acidimicrobiales bacterium]|jgi:2,4-dienoyl-CoA reductase (NADPH2)|nr:FAD-dependent oxidoreductase [Acidimicrobiales bacterium]